MVYNKLLYYYYYSNSLFYSDKSKLKIQDPQEIKTELVRAQKWAKMIQNWNKISPEKLKRRVYKGIPNSLRSQVWAKLLRVDQLTDDQKNKYKVIIYFRIYFILSYNNILVYYYCPATNNDIRLYYTIFFLLNINRVYSN